LKHLYYGVDQDQPLADSEPALQSLLQWLNRNPEIRIEVQGHTDATGSPQHNLDLSNRRAQYIRNWLIVQGCDPRRLVAVGYGSSRPLSTDDLPESRAKDRRTQISILP
jgi:outer membrane protein OmpA-like peptidoglycan-associated protein